MVLSNLSLKQVYRLWILYFKFLIVCHTQNTLWWCVTTKLSLSHRYGFIIPDVRSLSHTKIILMCWWFVTHRITWFLAAHPSLWHISFQCTDGLLHPEYLATVHNTSSYKFFLALLWVHHIFLCHKFITLQFCFWRMTVCHTQNTLYWFVTPQFSLLKSYEFITPFFKRVYYSPIKCLTNL